MKRSGSQFSVAAADQSQKGQKCLGKKTGAPEKKKRRRLVGIW